MNIDDARMLAHDHLAREMPRRWAHVCAVAAQAERLVGHLKIDRVPLVCSALLHDLGYAQDLVDTGFHPLDGARYLRAVGWPDEVCALVAHHTCARVEAARRGVLDQLQGEFTDHPDAARDALWTADATTGPDGKTVTLDERVADVVQRYGPDHLVAQCMRAIRPELQAAIERTYARMPLSVSYPM